MANKIREFFDNVAPERNIKIESNVIVDYEQKVRSEMVIALIDAKPGEIILDAGCGNARDLIQLCRTGCKCVGIDFSPDMIEEGRKELLKNQITSARIEVGDLTKLRFQNETFDKVFASEVIEHIPDYNKAISEIIRVLKPGGCAVITTPNRHSWYGFDRYIIWEKIIRRKHPHPYDAWKTYGELDSVLNDNGLKIVSIAGICYTPGSLVPYHLPVFLQKILIKIVSIFEPWLSKTFPKNGYMLAIKAIKK